MPEPSVAPQDVLPPPASPRRARLSAGIVLWAACVLATMFHLENYAVTAGASAATPHAWPTSSVLPPSVDRSTLIMFVHPHCPCTRASLEELARLLAHCGTETETRVVFVRPSRLPAGWERTDLWIKVTALPGVQALVDVDGVEARRFGARTSGQVYLYDRSGTLRFQGGITSARGHEGSNLGSNAVSDWIRDRHADVASTPVFGCALFDPATPESRGGSRCCPR